jgi:hypothetical protein
MIDKAGNEEEAEFMISRIPSSEQKFIEEGAWFTWTIYRDIGTHQVSNEFIFDRTTWTKAEIDAAKDYAKNYYAWWVREDQ